MEKQARTVSMNKGSWSKEAALVWHGGNWCGGLVYLRESAEGQKYHVCPTCVLPGNRKPVLHRVTDEKVEVRNAVVSQGFGGKVVIHRPEADKKARATHWCWNCGRFFRLVGAPLGPVENVQEETLRRVQW